MNAQPLISVIIPAYNSEETIERAVSSVLNQSYENVEAIVVDDGSKDGTADAVRGMMKDNSRVRLLSKKNAGVSAARNDGIRMASGEWFVTLDADDYIDTDMIRRLWETADECGADTVICGFRMVYDDGRKKAFRMEEDYTDEKEEFIDAVFIELYDKHMISTHSNKLYKTSLVRQNQIYYNENLAVNEDIDFVLRYLRFCKTISVIRGVYLNYVQQETGKSLNTTFQHYGVASSLLVLRDCDALFADLDLSDRVFDEMNIRLLLHVCSFAGLMYYRSGYSDEKKMEEIAKLCDHPDFRQLLIDTKPRGLKQRIAHFLLKHRMVKQYHSMCKLLYGRLAAKAALPVYGDEKAIDDGYWLLEEDDETFETLDMHDGIDTALIRAAIYEEDTQKTDRGASEVTIHDMEQLKALLKEDQKSEGNL